MAKRPSQAACRDAVAPLANVITDDCKRIAGTAIGEVDCAGIGDEHELPASERCNRVAGAASVQRARRVDRQRSCASVGAPKHEVAVEYDV